VSPDLLFSICNYGILPGWLLLILAPRWRWAADFICPIVLPGLLGAIYVGILVSQWADVEGSFNSLKGVETLFTNRYALVGGWIHYLAFDLFIGSWEVRDARRIGITHWFVIPCLVLTLLFGPAVLLMYLAVRLGISRSTLLGST